MGRLKRWSRSSYVCLGGGVNVRWRFRILGVIGFVAALNSYQIFFFKRWFLKVSE